MAQLVFEENTRVLWVATYAGIADISAPTVAELTGATALTALLTKDGFQPGVSENAVAAGNLATALDAEVPGSFGYQLTLRYFRDDTTDTAFELFPRLSQGYVVVSPFGFGGADKDTPVATDKVHIWKGETGIPQLANSAANERQTATTRLYVADADLYAVVAA